MARSQCCTFCGNPDRYEFQVDRDMWAAVVPASYKQGTVCLACFDTLAGQAGIRYAGAIKAVYFFGERAALELSVSKAIDLEPIGLRPAIKPK